MRATLHSANYTFLVFACSAYRRHIIFAVLAEMGSAHQVQDAPVRSSETGHRLWELRGVLAELGSELPQHLQRFTIRWTWTAEVVNEASIKIVKLLC